MDVADITQGIFFITQIVVGLLGNVVIILSHLHVLATKHILKPIDVTVLHLALANVMTLVFMGIPEVIFLFGVKKLFTSAACKAIVYIYRVARAVSVSTTCTLSVFQSVTIAPVTSCWGKLKLTLPKYLTPSFLFFWILNFVSNTHITLYMTAVENNTLPVNSVNMGFCYIPHFKKCSVEAILAHLFIYGHDYVLMLVMVLASGHIWFTLKRHHQHVKYIKRSNKNHRKTAEEQAADTIIKLVTLYIFFYGVDIGFLTYTVAFRKQESLLLHIRVFFSFCYPALSPIILSTLNKKKLCVLSFLKKVSILKEGHPMSVFIAAP